LLHGFGVVIYGVLWLVLPNQPGGRSGVDRVVAAVRTLLGSDGSRDRSDASGARPADDSNRQGSSGEWRPTRS